MLIELTSIADEALPVEDFKAHLRMGTAFGVEDVQDGVIAGFLRAAIAAIESRTDKALISRGFAVVISAVRSSEVVYLPVAPVSQLDQLVMIDRSGTEELLGVEGLRLERDAQLPLVRGRIDVPVDGQARLEFTAGFGVGWADVPADLRQAVMMLAAHYYEYRSDTALSAGCMPFGVTSLIERYRPVRIGFGGGV